MSDLKSISGLKIKFLQALLVFEPVVVATFSPIAGFETGALTITRVDAVESPAAAVAADETESFLHTL